MKITQIILFAALGMITHQSPAQQETPERDAKLARRELVRGDTGKWNDDAKLQHAPPLQRKPQNLSLDNWADQLLASPVKTTSDDDNCLIFRTRQLDDNDRVWVETIEQQGNEFTIVMKEAIWQGYYWKTFTGYEVLAVNLGKLPMGEYRVKWIIKPFVFKQFDGTGKPTGNWPKEEQPAAGDPKELSLGFLVDS